MTSSPKTTYKRFIVRQPAGSPMGADMYLQDFLGGHARWSGEIDHAYQFSTRAYAKDSARYAGLLDSDVDFPSMLVSYQVQS